MDAQSLELWGGVECTVNRVGDRFFDQMERNGHAWREDDLDRFASLGLKALRYPVLWERLAPERAVVEDWSWPDRRLHRLRELGIRPIVGLVHHGSGPRRTNLLDPGFAAGLADFARQVAERYPWIEDYTPVNEPLTTARFSALYGHWYPHTHDTGSFAQAFLNQCKAVVLAMRAIRGVNPAARLLQTEDLGKTFSTAALADQAEFENQRRWLTFDLLGGHLNEKHPMWVFLTGTGIAAEELAWFLDNPCPPDLLGINHYVTSERFLDERMDRYPAYAYVNNQGRAYADMPAVRASAQGVSGPGRLLREAWERYRIPLAVTEAQLNCTRDEQMRWFAEIWRDARALRSQEGVDVRAITSWALLGAFNWINLLTREDPNSYEPGAFDVRAASPRRTAMGTLARTLARDGDTDHPVLSVPGWWRRPSRFACQPAEAYQPLTPAVRLPEAGEATAAPLLGIGAGSTLGHAFKVVCAERVLPISWLDDDWLAGADHEGLRSTLETVRPWAVIIAMDQPGAVSTVAEADRQDARTRQLAEVCAELGTPLLVFSLDPAPGNGSSSFQEENSLASVHPAKPSALVVSTGVRFGPWDEHDSVLLAATSPVADAPELPDSGQPFTLTYLPDLVHGCLDLLLDGESGPWHLSNAGTLDRVTLLACAARMTSTEVGQNDPQPDLAGPVTAHLPHHLLSSDNYLALPSWQSALRHLMDTHLPRR